MEVCSDMGQFEKYENLYINLAMKDRYSIENTTGCLYPCSYPEYRIGDKGIFNKMGGFGFWISYGSVAVTVKKEVDVVSSEKMEFLENCLNFYLKLLRCTVTISSPWSLMLEELLVSSSVSPSLLSGISSRTWVIS